MKNHDTDKHLLEEYIGNAEISKDAKKILFYLIANCKQKDGKVRDEYSFSTQEFAEIIGTDISNVYQKADKMTTELVLLTLKKAESAQMNETKRWEKFKIVSKCMYDPNKGVVSFRLTDEMTNILKESR